MQICRLRVHGFDAEGGSDGNVPPAWHATLAVSEGQRWFGPGLVH